MKENPSRAALLVIDMENGFVTGAVIDIDGGKKMA